MEPDWLITSGPSVNSSRLRTLAAIISIGLSWPVCATASPQDRPPISETVPSSDTAAQSAPVQQLPETRAEREIANWTAVMAGLTAALIVLSAIQTAIFIVTLPSQANARPRYAAEQYDDCCRTTYSCGVTYSARSKTDYRRRCCGELEARRFWPTQVQRHIRQGSPHRLFVRL